MPNVSDQRAVSKHASKPSALITASLHPLVLGRELASDVAVTLHSVTYVTGLRPTYTIIVSKIGH